MVGVGVLVGGYFIANAFMNSKNKRSRPPKVAKVAPTVIVETVQNQSIPIEVKASGSVMAKNRIELFAEVQGVFRSSAKPFKPGIRYRKGEVFLKMDAEEQYATLQAQKSTLYNQISLMLPDLKIDYPDAFPRWEQYVNIFDLEKPVPALPETTSTQERVFVSSKNVYTTYYNIKSLEIRQQKYVLTAPFDGVLTEALVTPGTLVRPGQQLGEFIATDVFEMEVAVGVSLMPFMQVGKAVQVRSMADPTKTWQAKVIRINGKVDRTTQTGDVFLEIRAKDIEEGMYLEAIINAKEEENAYEIDRKLLFNENKVFVVEDSTLAMATVQPVYFDTDHVVIKGLPNGTALLAKSVPGAYEGMAVKILEQ